MNRWIAMAVAVFAILSGVYFGSPYYAVHSLRSAALHADTDELEAAVDFPAVRENLKSQLSAVIMTKMQNDPDMRDNPFAGLGAMLMPAIVDRMVDGFVTPSGISAVMQGRKPSATTALEANADIESSTGYVTLDRFRVRTRNTKLDEEGPSFLLERRGFASWRLIRLELPAKLLAG